MIIMRMVELSCTSVKSACDERDLTGKQYSATELVSKVSGL